MVSHLAVHRSSATVNSLAFACPAFVSMYNYHVSHLPVLHLLVLRLILCLFSAAFAVPLLIVLSFGAAFISPAFVCPAYGVHPTGVLATTPTRLTIYFIYLFI